VVGFLFSLYLHFCNGIRHLFWDVGYGFEMETVDLTAKLAIGMAVVLTIVTWMVGGPGLS
jgi:succinate dehydrogenase / fumarate reductase cytochrome b subunit